MSASGVDTKRRSSRRCSPNGWLAKNLTNLQRLQVDMPTRRAYLTALGGGSVVALAGCSSQDDDGLVLSEDQGAYGRYYSIDLDYAWDSIRIQRRSSSRSSSIHRRGSPFSRTRNTNSSKTGKISRHTTEWFRRTRRSNSGWKPSRTQPASSMSSSTTGGITATSIPSRWKANSASSSTRSGPSTTGSRAKTEPDGWNVEVIASMFLESVNDTFVCVGHRRSIISSGRYDR